VIHSKELLEKKYYDYLIFGHRHLPLDIKINESSRYINIGDWIQYNTYGEFDGSDFHLKYFNQADF
jgi:UDP-2,3-diacylglucosamine hydrolase